MSQAFTPRGTTPIGNCDVVFVGYLLVTILDHIERLALPPPGWKLTQNGLKRPKTGNSPDIRKKVIHISFLRRSHAGRNRRRHFRKKRFLSFPEMLWSVDGVLARGQCLFEVQP